MNAGMACYYVEEASEKEHILLQRLCSYSLPPGG